MESWSYGSGGKGLSFTDEMDLPVDAFARTRKPMVCWDIEPSHVFGALESMELMNFGLSDVSKKPFYCNELANDSAKRLVSPTCMFSSSSCYVEEQSGSNHCTSLMESNSQESSVIDLKLGRLADYKDAQDSKTCVVSSVHQALTAKKARRTSSPCCQVYGCNKDLSSSKDYHKRHKVCEAHSKTVKVIVNGIEQRFCQQCSRFHLLAEFDDGKRSCRKRLAGHNERRRKHYFNALAGKPGTNFPGSSILKGTPFVIPHVPQGDSEPEWAVAITNGQWVPKSSFQVHAVGGTFTSATEAFNDPNVEELYGVAHSDYALSLLSAPSQYLSSHAHHSSEEINGFHSYGMNPMGVGQEGSIGVSGAGHTVNFEVQTNGSGLLTENQTGVHLLKLSTDFQRVERQRNSIQVKQESEDLCYFITI